MCSRILNVFVLVWAPRNTGQHRLDRQCAHAWAFQAVHTMAMLSEDGAISWKPGGLLLVPFAVVSCARARAGFIRPCECATQGGLVVVLCGPIQPDGGGVFHGTPFRRPVRLRAVSAVRASGGPAGSCEGACARKKCGALCCAERQGHPCSPTGGPLPGNLIASKSLEDAPGCGLSPPRLHWGAGRVHLA